MGIKNFKKAFGSGVLIKAKDLSNIMKDQIVAIDMTIYVHSAVVMTKRAMTDANGSPTGHLKTIISNIKQYRAAGASRIVAVFDNKARNPMKERIYQERRAIRMKALKKMAECNNESDEEKYSRQAWAMTDAIIDDAKKLLNMYGVEYHVAPVGIEAEQYASKISNIVVSNDSDSIMFGAMITIMRCKGKLYVFNLQDILCEHNLTKEKFQTMCIALGTDFAPKTRGVGAKTVFTKKFELTDDQMAVLAYINDVDYETSDIVVGERNDEKLKCWLVNEKGFNPKLVKL